MKNTLYTYTYLLDVSVIAVLWYSTEAEVGVDVISPVCLSVG